MRSLMVFGSINLDFGVRAPRFPQPGETLLGGDLQVSPGGKGANQAHAARLFGTEVSLIGAIGGDRFGELALACLQASGVDLSGVRTADDAATGAASVIVTDSGDNAIVVAPGANELLREEWISLGQITAHETLLLQMEVPVHESMSLARRFKTEGGRVILNLAPARDLHHIDPSCIDWLILNQSELAILSKSLSLAAPTPADGAVELSIKWGCAVVVTLGAAGSLASLPGGELVEVKPFAVDARDTTGAGDTFCGVMAAALTEGYGSVSALQYAGLAASLACRTVGAQVAQPRREEIDLYVDDIASYGES